MHLSAGPGLTDVTALCKDCIKVCTAHKKIVMIMGMIMVVMILKKNKDNIKNKKIRIW